MAWDPDMVTAANYKQIKFHHQNYGELRLWSLSCWAVCARVVRAPSQPSPLPRALSCRVRLASLLCHAIQTMVEAAIARLCSMTGA